MFAEARFYDNIRVTRLAEHKPLFNFLLIPRVYRETENRAHVCPISWGVLRNPPGGTNATITRQQLLQSCARRHANLERNQFLIMIGHLLNLPAHEIHIFSKPLEPLKLNIILIQYTLLLKSLGSVSFLFIIIDIFEKSYAHRGCIYLTKIQ